MERGQTPKILCLAPNSFFVSFSLLFHYFSSLFDLSFFSLKAFVWLKPCTHDVHILKYVRPLYLGASTEAYCCYFLSIKLITYVRFPHMYLFFAIICIDMT